MGQLTGDDLIKAIEALMKEGHRAKDLAESSKMGEPAVTISLGASGIWHVDLYSYCLDLGDRSRHHERASKSLDGLVNSIWVMVKMAEYENDATELDATVKDGS